MGREFMGIVRSSFLIGKTGQIEEVWPAVHAKGHATEVLKRIAKQ
jgi:peroxiredoxin Q/BCP